MNIDGVREAILRGLRADSNREPERLAAAFRAFTPDDWKSFLRQINSHRLAPLFYAMVEGRAGALGIPADIVEKLRAAYLNNSARNMLTYQELKRVLLAFEEDGIPVIALKGAHLAELVYKNIAARPMSDLDILIHEEDLERADRILLRLRFLREERHPHPAPEANELHYNATNSNVRLDVHWRLLPSTYPFRIDIDSLWRHSRESSLVGVPVLTLSPEDLLLHICVHLSVHLFCSGLRNLCDISAILRLSGETLNWPRFREQSRSWGGGNCVYLVLLLASRLLYVGIPEDVLRVLRPSRFAESFYETAKDAVLSTDCRFRSSPFIALKVNLFGGRKGIGQKLLFLRKRLIPSAAAIAVRYPVSVKSPWLPFFYLKRLAIELRRNAPAAKNLIYRRIRKPHSDTASLMDWLISR
jgi:hypothetical protein